MERNSGTGGDDECIDLPPGFRFHPTDEELITHYLSPKVLDTRFHSLAIGEVDLNKCEPWDLPCKCFHCSIFMCFVFCLPVIIFFCLFYDKKGELRWERSSGTSSASGTGSTRPA